MLDVELLHIPTNSHWVERREGRFLLFSRPHEDGSRGAVRYMLQGAAATARRKARLQQAEGFHESAHHRVLWQIQEGRCYFSGASLGMRFEEGNFSVDHLRPIATRPPPFGGIPGTNWPVNLALVLPRVNSMKGADDAATFVWRLRHRPQEFRLPFKPTSNQVRAMMDRKRFELFASFMNEHCPNWEDQPWLRV